ncbi:MAG TPA: phosphomannomutase/phosphoglucomutase [Kiritimatiellia bacterium]|mgnify:CR=1 FL=1|jgi:phosphomannomutase|nr:phosphomannomutase/phosphoglucomutase [Kiritimatiellia bacterium]HOM59317.1 phosphomannomutase/phosphoglucomutase [Kiritimatiellia bacterium]HOR97362.1 phosphomannomutase/phosphoglucomutase [Kiritimatiellia bacterium]HPC48854.1 phosphomannomutase/phosphoglucomutase [Kiritimatiellia bacterium]HPK37508.1 phosphomannomutase/phosphoglucomutase [Kiritimatiellia bacterium]
MAFFKAYDMRGVFGRDFDLDMVWRIGRWLPSVLGARRMLVGRDARVSSEPIAEALCRGLTEAGCAVEDIGLATTPMVYFFTAQDGYDASVQITASHNPAHHNGMKVSRAGAVPVGYDTGLAEIKARVASGTLPPPAPVPGRRSDIDVRDRFIAWLRERCPDLTGLKLAVDCSDGMAGLVIREVLGEGPLYLNATPDGRFPNHSPNPLEAESRVQVAEAVRKHGLDVGVIFDGDADRVMFVDETGGFVQPDYLIPVIARTFLQREPGATVLHDVRTSRGVIEALREDGARPVMGRVGHAFAKVRMRETGAVCGGELAGHYYFRDFFCCDSGELAALMVLGVLAEQRRRGVTFSAHIAPIRRYANSGECNYRVRDPDAAIAAALRAAEAFGTVVGRSEIDGVRLEWTDGWLSLRPSHTEPYLRLIVEAEDGERLARRLDVLETALAPFAEEGSVAVRGADGHA